MAFPHVYIKCFKKDIYIYIYIEHTDRAIRVFWKLEPVALVRQ